MVFEVGRGKIQRLVALRQVLIGWIVQISGKSRIRQELTENRVDNILGYHAILINQQNVGTIASCIITGGNDLNK